jgi:hypothetical protein
MRNGPKERYFTYYITYYDFQLVCPCSRTKPDLLLALTEPKVVSHDHDRSRGVKRATGRLEQACASLPFGIYRVGPFGLLRSNKRSSLVQAKRHTVEVLICRLENGSRFGPGAFQDVMGRISNIVGVDFLTTLSSMRNSHLV